MDIYDFYDTIETKKDFELFLAMFYKDFKENEEDWENNTLDFFLEALHRYNVDVGEEKISWRIVAKMLLAAKIYE